MRLRVLCLGLVAATAATGNRADGQEKPFAFFSNSANLPADGAPGRDARIDQLYLRPNVEQAAYLYVHNPADGRDRTDIAVILWQGGKDSKGRIELARGKVAVKKGQTARVALAAPGGAKPAAPPPPQAPAPAAGEKAAPPPVPAPTGLRLVSRTDLTLQVIDEKEQLATERQLEERTVVVDVRSPRELLEQAVPNVPKDSNTFVVQLKFNKTVPLFTDKPAKVRLDIRPDLNPELVPDPNAGTYEADLPTDGEARLVAEGVRFAGGEPARRSCIVAVTLDGVDRALLFRTNFSGVPTEVPDTEPFVNVKPTATKLLPGKPCQVQMEFSNVDEKANPFADLRLDRFNRTDLRKGFDDAKSDLVQHLAGLRKKETYVRFGGPDDAIGLTTVLIDWSYDFPTAGVFGVRTFKLQAVNPRTGPETWVPTERQAAAQAEFRVYNVRPIALDRTPPAAKIALPTVKLVAGDKVTVTAHVTEDLTDITQVLFYLGDPPAADAKLVPGRLVKGKLLKDAGPQLDRDAGLGPRDRVYEAVLTLPEQRGPVQIGVKAVNEVGLASKDDEGISFVIADVLPPPTPKEKEKEKTTGTIKGKIMQGSRAQPKLPVTLWDAAGKTLIKSTTSDDNGDYKFEDVPAGSYIVASVKKQDSAKGKAPATVEGGKTTEGVDLNVLR
jgi:hypothetical protein